MLKNNGVTFGEEQAEEQERQTFTFFLVTAQKNDLSDGSQIWLHIKSTCRALKSTDAWASPPQILIPAGVGRSLGTGIL